MADTDDAGSTIDPVSVEELADAAMPGAPMDESSRRLLAQERKALGRRRTANGLRPLEDDRLTGIALSGGGIRSATFCLGVLQALAKEDLLKRFDYLSTVSGGGYIGSSLTWWLSGRWREEDPARDHAPDRAQEHGPGLEEAPARDPLVAARWAFGLDAGNFPYGVGRAVDGRPADQVKDAKGAGPHLLNYLRKHGNYLTPGEGINILSGISVVIRAVFLNLFVWIPLVTLGFVVLYWLPSILFPCSTAGGGDSVGACLSNTLNQNYTTVLESLGGGSGAGRVGVVFWDAVIISLIFTGFALFYHTVVVRLHRPAQPDAAGPGRNGWLERLTQRCLAGDWRIWLTIIGGLSVIVLLSSPPELPANFEQQWLLILSAILVATYGLICLIYSLGTYIVSRFSVGHEFGYSMRGLFETWASVYLSAVLVLAVIGSVPLVDQWLRTPESALPATTAAPGTGSGLMALLAGLVATIAAFFRSGAKVAESLRARGWQVSGGVTATLAAALLLFGVLLISHQASLAIQGGGISPMVAVVVLLAAVASGILVNTNNISLGRFYRDRLLGAFMPGYDAAVHMRTEAAPMTAERMRLTEASTAAPYHIVNTNVVLISAADRRRRMRGGDSFILTRDYCGSNATGWRRTDEFMAGKMTLPSAMAISGAAANPNTGVGGVGPTRSKVVSALMSLVNLRLGYWAPHPTKADQTDIPNHFRPGLTSFIRGHTEDYRFQELTDGGHFENLAIYELIRRRVRLILVCDAGADPNFQFEDLQSALHRIEEDFGAKIVFAKDYRIEDLIPEKVEGTAYPKGLEQAKRGFAVADIYYASELDREGVPLPGAQPARLIYLKTTIVPELPFDLRGYKGSNPSFPDQATGDQFFDEDQFEAYRELGQRLATAMIEALPDLDTHLPKDLSTP